MECKAVVFFRSSIVWGWCHVSAIVPRTFEEMHGGSSAFGCSCLRGVDVYEILEEIFQNIIYPPGKLT